MDERIEKWLQDVLEAILEIESFFPGASYNFFEYKENLMRKRAVEGNLEIIGEAVNRIIKRDAAYEEFISATRSIIALRNHVIHAYDNISDENIWAVLVKHLPKLKTEVQEILRKKFP
jgi:uncharacterized protein with HEPN domain